MNDARRGAIRSRRLILCADDYAFTPGVSRAIRELLAARRISATSVMTSCPHWPEEAPALLAVAGDADLGLHVTLTDQRPIGPMPTYAPEGRFPPMAAVYKAGLMRRLPLAEIEVEIERQLEAFVRHAGRAPAHIDGHHHIHQLPGVRDIVLGVARRIGATSRIWVRACAERPALIARRGIAIGKALMIGALGGAMARRAKRLGVATNQGFSGAYDFNNDPRPLEELFARFVVGSKENALVMCHPGYADELLASLDAMTTVRDRELAYLMSDAWPALLASRDLELGSFRHA